MSNIIDVIYLGVFLIIIAVTMTVVLLILNQFYTNPIVQSTFTAEELVPITTAQTVIGYFDYLLVFIMVLYCIAALITAYYIKTHPVFYVAMLVLQLIAVAISAVLSNLWQSIASDPILMPITNTFTYTPLILNNLPIIVLVLSSMIAIVSYSTPSNPYEQ